MNRNSVALEQAGNSLSVIWFIRAGFIFFILALQSILGKYEGTLQEVWAWLLPTVLPALALILGVIGASALIENQDSRRVK